MDDQSTGRTEVSLYSFLGHQLRKSNVDKTFKIILSSPQMSALCRRLDELWEENQGCVVLFTWIQLLKEEALDFLGIQSPLEIIRGGSKACGERRKTDSAATGKEVM